MNDLEEISTAHCYLYGKSIDFCCSPKIANGVKNVAQAYIKYLKDKGEI